MTRSISQQASGSTPPISSAAASHAPPKWMELILGIRILFMRSTCLSLSGHTATIEKRNARSLTPRAFHGYREDHLPATVSVPASTEGLPVLEPKKSRSLPTARMFFSTA